MAADKTIFLKDHELKEVTGGSDVYPVPDPKFKVGDHVVMLKNPEFDDAIVFDVCVYSYGIGWIYSLKAHYPAPEDRWVGPGDYWECNMELK